MCQLRLNVFKKLKFCLISIVILHIIYYSVRDSKFMVKLYNKWTDQSRVFDHLPESQSSYGTLSQTDAYKNVTRSENNECDLIEPQLSTTPLPVTGLVSFPGAGNTWVRHLLQQVSGLGTASLPNYCDRALRKKGFPLECHREFKDVLAVKTHQGVQTGKRYSRIILIIRRPLPNILAYFNWENTHNHVGYPSIDAFIEKWPSDFPPKLDRWETFNLQWLAKYNGSIFPLLNENLKDNPYMELKRLFKFLKVKVSDGSIRCAVVNQEGNFHREKVTVLTDKKSNRTLSLDNIFTAEMVQNASVAFQHVAEYLQRNFNMTWK